MSLQYKGQPPDLRHYVFARNSGLPRGYFDPPPRWRGFLKVVAFLLVVWAFWAFWVLI